MSFSHMPASRARWWPRITVYDLLCAFSAPLIAICIRDETVLIRSETAGLVYAAASFVTTLAMLAYFRVGSELVGYFSPHDMVQVAKASFAAVAIAAAVVFSLTRLQAVPRSLPAIHFLVLTFLLVGVRALVRLVALDRHRRSRTAEHGSENIVLVGADYASWLFVRAIYAACDRKCTVVAVLDVDLGRVGRTLAGYRIIGDCAIAADLSDELRVHGVSINRFVVTTRAAAPGTTGWSELSHCCSERGIALEYLPERLGPQSGIEGKEADDSPWMQETATWYWHVKRGFDIAAAAAALVILSPILLAIGLLVVISFGWPVLFWQERLGRHARPIQVHKFCTLRAPFDRFGRQLSDSERETSLGRRLRATRLDELPQLLDILRGDMSLIGPRPLLPVDQPADARHRLSVSPGLTGWAQVRGGRMITPEEKNALDVWYIQHASLWLDLKILLLTAKVIVCGELDVSPEAMPLPRPEIEGRCAAE